MWLYLVLILGAVYLKFETPKPCPCNKNGAPT